MKLDEMLSIQKSASDRTSLGYDFSSSNVASTSATVFVPPSNNVEIENCWFLDPLKHNWINLRT